MLSLPVRWNIASASSSFSFCSARVHAQARRRQLLPDRLQLVWSPRFAENGQVPVVLLLRVILLVLRFLLERENEESADMGKRIVSSTAVLFTSTTVKCVKHIMTIKRGTWEGSPARRAGTRIRLTLVQS